MSKLGFDVKSLSYKHEAVIQCMYRTNHPDRNIYHDINLDKNLVQNVINFCAMTNEEKLKAMHRDNSYGFVIEQLDNKTVDACWMRNCMNNGIPSNCRGGDRPCGDMWRRPFGGGMYGPRPDQSYVYCQHCWCRYQIKIGEKPRWPIKFQ
eukprot:222422_1